MKLSTKLLTPIFAAGIAFACSGDESDFSDDTSAPDDDCLDATGGCTDPVDDCEDESSTEADCVDYEFADIISYELSCDGLGYTLTSTMATAIPSSWDGRFQVKLFAIEENGAEHGCSGIGDDGPSFRDSNSCNEGDSTSVDGQGRLVQTLSAATISGYGAPITHIKADTFLSLNGAYRADVTAVFPNPCQ